MCLILIAHRTHPAYRLVLAANRDEFHDRPTAAAAYWREAPEVLAGRDLRAGGTWLGITRTGRLAAVTSYRDPSPVRPDAPSRGELVSGFLLGRDRPTDYLKRIRDRADEYNGFNLILGDGRQIHWYSNRSGDVRTLDPGIYGLSNHLLDTPWPKVVRGKEALSRLLARREVLLLEDLFAMLADRSYPGNAALPYTGVGPEWERLLSPLFIASPDYGTRSSTVLVIDDDERVGFVERTFDASSDHATTAAFEFSIAGQTKTDQQSLLDTIREPHG
jgi:uncharacterized protein with NRDE domain